MFPFVDRLVKNGNGGNAVITPSNKIRSLLQKNHGEKTPVVFIMH